MKKIGLALAAVATLGLVGCTSNLSDTREEGGFYVDGFVDTRTGEQLYCVFASKGVSCDFGNELGLNKK